MNKYSVAGIHAAAMLVAAGNWLGGSRAQAVDGCINSESVKRTCTFEKGALMTRGWHIIGRLYAPGEGGGHTNGPRVSLNRNAPTILEAADRGGGPASTMDIGRG